MSEALSWDDQRVFLAVLEGGSLSAASRNLGVSLPTVRSRLEGLERILGATLFTRSPQGLVPTDHARNLQGHVRLMDHASRAFLRAAAARPGEVRGTVRISVAEVVGMEVLPAMLARLKVRYPALALEVDLSNVTANVTEQAADIAIRMFPPEHDALVAKRVGGIALGLFAHRDYIARRGAPTSLDDLLQHELIGPDRSPLDRRFVQERFPAGLLSRISVRTDSHPAQLALARAGLGIAVMHRALGQADERLVQVLPALVPDTLPVWLVKHRDLRQEPRVRVTFDHLAAEFARYCDA